MRYESTIHIIEGPSTSNESEALRQALEYFGYRISKSVIGRPADLKKHLNENRSRFVILSIHGLKGRMVMPELASEIYHPSEPMGDLEPKDLSDVQDLPDIHLMTSGCSLFTIEWQNLWRDKQVASYISPSSDVEGNSSLQFFFRYFYELIQHGRCISEAFEVARGIDDQTAYFAMFDKT